MPIPIEQRLAIEERRARVLKARLDGISVETIAQRENVTIQTIYTDYNVSIKRHLDNAPNIAGQVKSQNEQRLLGIIEAQQTLALKDPTSKAYDRMMRAIDMLNKMYGVYAPDMGAQQNSNQGNGLTIRYEQTNVTIQRDSSSGAQGTQHSLPDSTDYVIGSAQHSTAALNDGDSSADDTAQDTDIEDSYPTKE